MSPKCIKISICICFLIFSFALLVLAAYSLSSRSIVSYENDWSLRNGNPALIVQYQVQDEYSTAASQVNLRDMSSDSEKGTLNTPSLEAYLQALPGEEDQELRLNGLALYSKLTNACQPLVDISKSKFQGNKIALVSLDESLSPVCTLLGLAINAQNAGYSVLIFDVRAAPWLTDDNGLQTDTKDKLLIPVLHATDTVTQYFDSLEKADRRKVDISVQTADRDDLKNMRAYLSNLCVWFLLGPVITLEWLRRKKRLVSGALQQDHEESATFGNERSVRNLDEGGLRSEAQEPVANYDQETEHNETGGDEQLLIVVVNDPRFNLTTRMRQRTSIRVVVLFRKIFDKLAVGSGYVILILVALPVGISSGGWSFFRFDENEKFTRSFWDDFLKLNISSPESLLWCNGVTGIGVTVLDSFLPLWWSSLRIFCFFLYSRFACKNTWTVPSNTSKLIRSDWFASNMYLLILGVVVPYCSFTMADILDLILLAYFATYNIVCTICNLLFIIILNKHKCVTRYVFYISICMICAYIESDIVAVYYFMMNSEGSLSNLKLTALRTVAIGLTLTLSLSSSMHIIRKLNKPQESLFEGLGEK